MRFSSCLKTAYFAIVSPSANHNKTELLVARMQLTEGS
jgi:hypothetical protein